MRRIDENVCNLFDNLSEYLQSSSIEWHHAAHDIGACKLMISQFGNETAVAEMLEEAEEISADC